MTRTSFLIVVLLLFSLNVFAVTFFLSVQDCLQEFEHTFTLFTDPRCEQNEHRRETVIQYRSSEDPKLAFSTKSTLDCWFTSWFLFLQMYAEHRTTLAFTAHFLF